MDIPNLTTHNKMTVLQRRQHCIAVQGSANCHHHHNCTVLYCTELYCTVLQFRDLLTVTTITPLLLDPAPDCPRCHGDLWTRGGNKVSLNLSLNHTHH